MMCINGHKGPVNHYLVPGWAAPVPLCKPCRGLLHANRRFDNATNKLVIEGLKKMDKLREKGLVQ